MLVEADGVRAFAVVLLAIVVVAVIVVANIVIAMSNGADARGIAFHKPITDRPTVKLTLILAIVHIAAGFILIKLHEGSMMLLIRAVPLRPRLLIRGFHRILPVNMEVLPVAF